MVWEGPVRCRRGEALVDSHSTGYGTGGRGRDAYYRACCCCTEQYLPVFKSLQTNAVRYLAYTVVVIAEEAAAVGTMPRRGLATATL